MAQGERPAQHLDRALVLLLVQDGGDETGRRDGARGERHGVGEQRLHAPSEVLVEDAHHGVEVRVDMACREGRVDVAHVVDFGEDHRLGVLDAGGAQHVRIARVALHDALERADVLRRVAVARVDGPRHDDHALAKPVELLERADREALQAAQHDVAAQRSDRFGRRVVRAGGRLSSHRLRVPA